VIAAVPLSAKGRETSPSAATSTTTDELAARTAAVSASARHRFAAADRVCMRTVCGPRKRANTPTSAKYATHTS
jgi:hypothetical protein